MLPSAAIFPSTIWKSGQQYVLQGPLPYFIFAFLLAFTGSLSNLISVWVWAADDHFIVSYFLFKCLAISDTIFLLFIPFSLDTYFGYAVINAKEFVTAADRVSSWAVVMSVHTTYLLAVTRWIAVKLPIFHIRKNRMYRIFVGVFFWTILLESLDMVVAGSYNTSTTYDFYARTAIGVMAHVIPLLPVPFHVHGLLQKYFKSKLQKRVGALPNAKYINADTLVASVDPLSVADRERQPVCPADVSLQRSSHRKISAQSKPKDMNSTNSIAPEDMDDQKKKKYDDATSEHCDQKVGSVGNVDQHDEQTSGNAKEKKCKIANDGTSQTAQNGSENESDKYRDQTVAKTKENAEAACDKGPGENEFSTPSQQQPKGESVTFRAEHGSQNNIDSKKRSKKRESVTFDLDHSPRESIESRKRCSRFGVRQHSNRVGGRVHVSAQISIPVVIFSLAAFVAHPACWIVLLVVFHLEGDWPFFRRISLALSYVLILLSSLHFFSYYAFSSHFKQLLAKRLYRGRSWRQTPSSNERFVQS